MGIRAAVFEKLFVALSISISGILAVSTAAAAADGAPASSDRAPPLVFRTEAFSGIRLFGDDGVFELFGESASLRMFNLVEGEVGVGLWANPCGTSISPTARLGVSLSVIAPRPSGAGWDVRIPLLIEYTYLNLSGSGCDAHPDKHVHLAGGAAGVDATFWGTQHVGFNIRALALAGSTRQTQTPCSYCEPAAEPSASHSDFASGGTVSLGVALPFP